MLQETSRWMQALRRLFVNDRSQTYDGDELDSHERLTKQGNGCGSSPISHRIN